MSFLFYFFAVAGDDKVSTASARILGQRIQLTPAAMELFIKTSPRMLDRKAFNEACLKQEGPSSLGCYDGKYIYLFNIPEPQLHYMVDVTAAHEFLHAVYDTLSPSEKNKLNAELLSAYALVRSPGVREKITDYEKRDPSVVPNELHSILGTEIKNLPPFLENHYRKYFTLRPALTDLAEKYYRDLEERKSHVKSEDQILEDLKKDLELRTKILKTKQGHLEIVKKQVTDSSPTEKVREFNLLAEQFNQELKQYQDAVSKYNSLVQKRNQKAQENKELYKVLDTKM